MALRLAVLIVLALPGTALAQWQAPVNVSGDVSAVHEPQVAYGGSGDALVAFGLQNRFAWWQSPPGAVRTTTTTDPAARLLPYAASRVLVVSRTSGRLPWELRARFGATNGALGAPRRLAPGRDVLSYSAGANARGDAVVAYVRNVRDGARIRRRVVEVVRRAGARPFGAPVTIAGRGNPTRTAAAVRPDGEVVVAYERAGRLEVRRRPPGKGWTSARVLGPAVAGHTQIDVAAPPDGGIAVAWFAQSLSEGGSNGPAAVRLAVRDPGGRDFQPARTLETFSRRAPQGAGVHVAAGVVGWTGVQAGRFVARAAGLGARLGQTVSDPSADAVLGGVAAGPDGAAIAVWAPPLDTPSPRVAAAYRPARTVLFGPPEAVSPAYREIVAPTVGIDPRTGAALAAWVARTGDRTQAVLTAVASRP